MDNMCAVEVMARLKEKHEIEDAKMMNSAVEAYSPIIDRIIDINEGKKEIK